MYARTTTLRADPATIDAGIAHVQSQVLPAVKDIEGYVGMSMLVDRESGRCISTTAWQSEEALQNSAEMVKPLRDTAVDNFGAGASEVDTWEIAVVHRDHAAPEGACARITLLFCCASQGTRTRHAKWSCQKNVIFSRSRADDSGILVIQAWYSAGICFLYC